MHKPLQILFSLCLLLGSSVSYADSPQNQFKFTQHGNASVELKYLQEGYDSISGIKIRLPHILQVGDNFSIYAPYNFFFSDSIQYAWKDLKKTLNEYMRAVDRVPFDTRMTERILRTFEPEMILTVRDRVFIDQYYYIEPQPDMQWQLSKEKKMIGSHECSKATLDYAGRHWTAWFDPTIPTPVGPWKFYGLPGAIVSITDSTGSHSFTLTEIRKPGGPVIEAYSEPYRIKRERLQMLKEKWALDKSSAIGTGPAAPRNLDGSLKKIPKYTRKDVYINPIHLD